MLFFASFLKKPTCWIISETQKWQLFYSDVLKKKIDFEKFHKLITGGYNTAQKSENHPTPVHTLLQKQHISSPLISMLLCAWSQPKKLIRARLIAVNKSQVSRKPQHPNAGFNPRAVHRQERTSAPGIHNFELLTNGLLATTRTAHFGFREKLKITIPDVQRNYNLGRRL